MTPIEVKKMTLEFTRVMAARMDLEIRIEEMKAEIERLQSHIVIQINKENELKEKLKENNV